MSDFIGGQVCDATHFYILRPWMQCYNALEISSIGFMMEMALLGLMGGLELFCGVVRVTARNCGSGHQFDLG